LSVYLEIAGNINAAAMQFDIIIRSGEWFAMPYKSQNAIATMVAGTANVARDGIINNIDKMSAVEAETIVSAYNRLVSRMEAYGHIVFGNGSHN